MTTIRAAGEADLADVLRIYNQAVEKTTAVFEYRAHTIEMRREWFRAKQAASLPVLVAEESGAVRGFASYGPFRAWPAYKYSVELSVYVDEAARGRGIGTALVTELFAEADASGRSVSIHVETNNPARRLYERLGFQDVGEHGVYVLMERAVTKMANA